MPGESLDRQNLMKFSSLASVVAKRLQQAGCDSLLCIFCTLTQCLTVWSPALVAVMPCLPTWSTAMSSAGTDGLSAQLDFALAGFGRVWTDQATTPMQSEPFAGVCLRPFCLCQRVCQACLPAVTRRTCNRYCLCRFASQHGSSLLEASCLLTWECRWWLLLAASVWLTFWAAVLWWHLRMCMALYGWCMLKMTLQANEHQLVHCVGARSICKVCEGCLGGDGRGCRRCHADCQDYQLSLANHEHRQVQGTCDGQQ